MTIVSLGKHRLARVYDGYTILSRLGAGRYGVCFLAHDRDGKQVVLKRFKPRMFRKNKEKNHFEAVMLSQIHHPAIPEMLGVVRDKNRYFYVLEYMPARTLEHWLFDEKKIFSRSEVLLIGTQLIGIIEYLQKNGMVHRDISIRNVLYDREQLYLVDFGLARFIDGIRYTAEIDYSYLGELLLYLLYSSFQSWGGKNFLSKKPWYEELELSQEQIIFLKKLLGIAGSFQSVRDIKSEFIVAFG